MEKSSSGGKALGTMPAPPPPQSFGLISEYSPHKDE
jgi:hypothetical protein